MDYSDLFDILSFFEGAPGSSTNNLDMAKKIGDRGKLFTKERWRLEDMQSFSLLQILEVSLASFGRESGADRT
jgi:beta-1,2-xylosyltransferase